MTRRGRTRATRLLGGFTALLTAVAVAGVPARAATSVVFADTFESGSNAGWVQVTHSGVQRAVVHSGSWAWRATNPNGLASYAYHLLPAGYTTVRISAYVRLISRSSTVKLLAMRSRAGRSLDVYVDQRGLVSVRNNIGAVTTYSRTIVATGGWHLLALQGSIGDGTGSLSVALDGVAVPGLTLSGQHLGTLPFDEIRLGDLAIAAVFDLAIDDLVVTAS